MVRRSDQQSLVIWTTLLCIKSSFSRYRTIRHGGYGSLFSLFGQALAGLQDVYKRQVPAGFSFSAMAASIAGKPLALIGLAQSAIHSAGRHKLL